MASDSSRTDVPLPPAPRFANFAITTAEHSAEIVAKVQQAVDAHPVLGPLFKCHRSGPARTALTCTGKKGKDRFDLRFNPDKSVLILGIVPEVDVIREPSYKPDYRYFDQLRDDIYQMLTSLFGEKAVKAS